MKEAVKVIILVFFLLTWYVTTGADPKKEAGSRRSYNVGLVPPDLVCDPRRISSSLW